MEHGKKLILVDPAAYARMQSVPLLHARSSQLDIEVRNILEGDEPDDVKAKHYMMVLNKFRVREPIKREESVVDEAEILESVPATVRHKAKRLMHIVKENPRLAWNERGELIHNQTTIDGSSIVELFNDILKQKRMGDDRPIGWREFSEGLGEVSKDLIPNYGSWKVISQNIRPVQPVVQTPATVRVARPRERTISTLRRSRQPRTIWDEY